MSEEKSAPSYHDVVVYVNGEAYRIFDNYALELTCTKVAGWRLWHTVNVWGAANQPVLIGGEYDGGDFRIEVAGVVICGERQIPREA